ncbi:ATP-binding protein [Marinomonas colpomeniae]|uniref:ATP-binding protein n=1 Tax=Marinomonas colpomeniae TaxID=2774408 RepID=A0ABR8NYL7_9GAMM|nr:ATP-binding protein [Marinomonas colpomeniae]MBD5770298.1 ATP-binding protein [Marinomonas colpomeniae]
MKVNAGGNIAPEQVIGRDAFINNMWRIIEQQSVILTSERRIGKTSIIRKMKEEPRESITVILRDVEGISTIKEFVTRLVDDLSSHQAMTTKGIELLKKVRNELSDSKFFGVTVAKKADPDWIFVLEDMIKKLANIYEAEDRKLLLIWDEFPWMLQKIIKNEGNTAAANLLDNLRLARQNHSRVRMIFTGSIGLHHVLQDLKAASLANEPTNDMQTINLSPLKLEHSIELTNQLLEGENLVAVEEDFAKALSQAVDNVPFYIHHMINAFLNKGDNIATQNIEPMIQDAFVDANDPWHLRHYDERLQEYYGEQYQFYQVILDILAQEEQGLDYEKLNNLLLLSPTVTNNQTLMDYLDTKNFLLEALRLLAADHYLTKDSENNTYNFSFSLIKQWWRIHRK